MNDIILFAVFVNNIENIAALTDCLNAFLLYCKGDKIYCGINYNSIPETEQIMRDYETKGLFVIYERQSEYITIDSDASAFQKALELLYKDFDSTSYNNAYFIHTKGGSTGNNNLRKKYLEILSKKEKINTILQNEIYGSYGIDITRSKESIEKGTHGRLSNICQNLKQSMGYFYPHTFFVIKGNIVKKILNDCTNFIYTENLIEVGFNRYFAEWHLSQLAQYYGLLPYYENYLQVRDKLTEKEIQYDFKLFLNMAWCKTSCRN